MIYKYELNYTLNDKCYSQLIPPSTTITLRRAFAASTLAATVAPARTASSIPPLPPHSRLIREKREREREREKGFVSGKKKGDSMDETKRKKKYQPFTKIFCCHLII